LYMAFRTPRCPPVFLASRDTITTGQNPKKEEEEEEEFIWNLKRDKTHDARSRRRRKRSLFRIVDARGDS
jgi:hypothetical protein